MSASVLNATVRIRPDVEALRRDVKRAGTTVETEMRRSGQQAGRKAGDEIGKHVHDGARTGARRAGMVINKELAQSMQRTGTRMTVGLTMPLVGIGAAAVKMAGGFETSMAKITALVGIPREQVKAWEDDVRGLAKTYGSTAGEAADALFFITSAGLRGQDAMSALEASLKASAIGLGDVAIVADLATSAMNAYGPSNLSATAATDVLTAAIREGKLEAGSLSGAMGRTLPLASAMGVEFNEVGAAFAAMSRTGTDANEAATQLNGILMSLQNPSSQADKQLAALGLSSSELRRQLKDEGLLAALQTLKVAFGENEEAAANVFNNSRALRGVLDMLGASADTTVDIFGNMANTAGITTEAFGVMADTMEFQNKQAMAELKDGMLEIGQVLMPIARDMANAIKGIAEAFNSLSPGMKQTIVYAGMLVAAAGPFLKIAGMVMQIAAAHNVAAVAAGRHAAASSMVGGGRMGGMGALGRVGVGAVGAGAAGWGAWDMINNGVTGKNAAATVGGGAALGWSIGGPIGAAIGAGAGAGAVGGGLIADRMGLANGGTVTSGGLVEVGERGREVLALPAGAQVSPNGGLTDLAGRLDTIASLLAAGGAGGMRVEVVNATGMDERRLARELDAISRRAAAVKPMTGRTR
jgi:TP901 family phage tail tape measure protein